MDIHSFVPCGRWKHLLLIELNPQYKPLQTMVDRLMLNGCKTNRSYNCEMPLHPSSSHPASYLRLFINIHGCLSLQSDSGRMEEVGPLNLIDFSIKIIKIPKGHCFPPMAINAFFGWIGWCRLVRGQLDIVFRMSQMCQLFPSIDIYIHSNLLFATNQWRILWIVDFCPWRILIFVHRRFAGDFFL